MRWRKISVASCEASASRRGRWGGSSERSSGRGAVRPPPTWADPRKAAAASADPALARQPVELLLVVRDHLDAANIDTVPFLVRVQQAHPADYCANLALATNMMQVRDLAGAVRYAQAAVVLRPEAALAHHILGVCLLDSGKAQEAIHEFREAARLDPAGAIYRGFLGIALARLGRHEEALRELDANSARPAMFTLFRATLCESLVALGRLDELVQQYRSAVSKPTGGSPWWASKLRSELVRHGRVDQVLSIWRAVLDAPPRADSLNHQWQGYA